MCVQTVIRYACKHDFTAYTKRCNMAGFLNKDCKIPETAQPAKKWWHWLMPSIALKNTNTNKAVSDDEAARKYSVTDLDMIHERKTKYKTKTYECNNCASPLAAYQDAVYRSRHRAAAYKRKDQCHTEKSKETVAAPYSSSGSMQRLQPFSSQPQNSGQDARVKQMQQKVPSLESTMVQDRQQKSRDAYDALGKHAVSLRAGVVAPTPDDSARANSVRPETLTSSRSMNQSRPHDLAMGGDGVTKDQSMPSAKKTSRRRQRALKETFEIENGMCLTPTSSTDSFSNEAYADIVKDAWKRHGIQMVDPVHFTKFGKHKTYRNHKG